MRDAEADFDCLVSPANSYGIMDGGIDMYISRAFGAGGDILTLSRAVQDDLYKRWYGFAPPTSCTLVRIPSHLRNTQYPRCGVLAICPTMRIPMNVSWHEDLVYNLMWTLLCELEHWNEEAKEEDKIRKVAIPGLATGIGAYDPEKCARQMVLAVKFFREARSQEGKERLANRAWTTNAFNILENAMQVADN
ncbi:macro domain-like protein [Peniophora sp. CONT]|nr:macro domain-like protein [Peniophora sp. CONT]